MDLYEAIYTRRDVREYSSEDVPEAVLAQILDAAHHAGSVGLMQPWNFLVIREAETRQRIAENFLTENARAAENYSGERRKVYESLTSNPILDSPVNIAVTCDRQRRNPHVLGRNTMLETDLYSTCCAIQNLWLAARAEGLGMCWMSILDPQVVKATLGIPDEIVLVGYLCLGYPVKLHERPLLEQAGWETRTPLREVVFSERWQLPWDHPDMATAVSPPSSAGPKESACQHEL